jgi:hypothetical protein
MKRAASFSFIYSRQSAPSSLLHCGFSMFPSRIYEAKPQMAFNHATKFNFLCAAQNILRSLKNLGGCRVIKKAHSN